MINTIKIGIIGDFNPDSPTHKATNESIEHAANLLKLAVAIQWVSTPSLEEQVGPALRSFDGLWCAPESPYKSMAGALNGIRFAREEGWPFFGT